MSINSFYDPSTSERPETNGNDGEILPKPTGDEIGGVFACASLSVGGRRDVACRRGEGNDGLPDELQTSADEYKTRYDGRRGCVDRPGVPVAGP